MYGHHKQNTDKSDFLVPGVSENQALKDESDINTKQSNYNAIP